MMSMNLKDISILNVKCSSYHCIISRISKSEAIKLLQNVDMTDILLHIKMETTFIKFGDNEIEKQKFH